MTDAILRAKVFGHFLEHGTGITVSELSEKLVCTKSILYRRLPYVNGTEWYQEASPTYSRNYRGVRHGSVLVKCWQPTREYLRQQLLHRGTP